MTHEISKIIQIQGFKIICLFDSMESRVIDFKLLFEEWGIKKGDFREKLLDPKEFEKVKIKNQTLCWSNVKKVIKLSSGTTFTAEYEVDPIVLYEKSSPLKIKANHRLSDH